jgi:PAS domain S-box-containing protein
MRETERLQVGAQKVERRELWDLTVVLAAVFFLSIFCLTLSFLETIYGFLKSYHLLHISPIVFQLIFLWVTGLLWMTYSRWRRAASERDEMEGVVRSIGLDLLLAVDGEGAVRLCNRSPEAIFGCTEDQIVGRNIRDLLSGAGQEGRWAMETPGVLEPGGPGTGKIVRQTEGGRETFIEVVKGTVGERGGAVYLFRDITERETAEREVRRYTAQLQAANRELQAFAHSVSHDLQAPLRAMDGRARMLLEDHRDALGEDGRDCLERMRAGYRHMTVMVRDLLDLSRITQWEMEYQNVDLTALALDTAARLREVQPDRKVNFVIEKEVAVEGDLRLLRVAMENMMGNAWKFTGDRTESRIEFGTDRRDGETVYFVRDNGAGFDMAFADKLFAPFERLHSESEFEGSGIGLATVHRAMSRHGGRVWAEGEVGKGATFYFTLA